MMLELADIRTPVDHYYKCNNVCCQPWSLGSGLLICSRHNWPPPWDVSCAWYLLQSFTSSKLLLSLETRRLDDFNTILL